MINRKIKKLLALTNEFLFIEYYSHTNCAMYKIKNEHTHFKESIYVLCPVSEGIRKAINLAIKQIAQCKKEFEGEST